MAFLQRLYSRCSGWLGIVVIKLQHINKNVAMKLQRIQREVAIFLQDKLQEYYKTSCNIIILCMLQSIDIIAENLVIRP